MPTNKTAKSTGERKKLAPSAATGPKGPAFENRVQAQRMLAMCLGGVPCAGIPVGHRIVKLQFQARIEGHQTDDLVCTVVDLFGAPYRVLMQMKRSLAPSTTAFEEAIGLAWLDYKTETFQRGADRFIFAYDVASVGDMGGASDIAVAAQKSLSVEGWLERVSAKNFGNDKRRKALEYVKTALNKFNKAEVPDAEVQAFLGHVHFLPHNLDSDDTAEAVQQQLTISLVTQVPGLAPLSADMVWSKLVTVCFELNGDAGEVNLENVGRFIGQDLATRLSMARTALTDRQGLIAFSGVPQSNNTAAAQTVPIAQTKDAFADSDLVPNARTSSANPLISRQLDHINTQIKATKFADALDALKALGQDLEPFDAHQKARWYLMRGSCVWHVHNDEKQAAADFLKAASLSSDDDKLAAAGIRGNLLLGDLEKARQAADTALARFPESLTVWISATNARTYAGETLDVADIPASHANDATAYQVIAAGLYRAGHLNRAVEVALEGLQKSDVSLFAREAALRYCLEAATRSPLQVAFRMAEAPVLANLRRALAEFLPRPQRLWAAQSMNVRSAVVSHLAYAHLLLLEPTETLAVLAEAEIHGVDDNKMLIRPHLEALRDLGREADALVYGQPLLSEMPEEALVSFAQVAANLLDDAALAKAVAAGSGRGSARLTESLTALRWDVLLRQGHAKDVLKEAEAQGTVASDCVPHLVLAGRAALDTGEQPLADQCIAKAAMLGAASSEPGLKYLVAQLLFAAKRFRDAAGFFEAILPRGAISSLHTDLLYCYLRTGMRAKAKALLDGFPSDWRENRMARQMAIDLGQQAGDWTLLESLVEPQLRDEPTRALSWLFKSMVATRAGKAEQTAVAQEIPAELEGSVTELTQLASFEMQSGMLERGKARLYRMRRERLGDIDAAAALFMAVALGPKLPGLYDAVEKVAPGTSVSLVDEQGQVTWRTLDPADMPDLPSTSEFHSANSADAKVLMGLRVGAAISGYTVSHIMPAFGRLAVLADETLRTTLVHSEIARAGTLDVKQLERKAKHVGTVLDAYGKGQLTLGVVASLVDTTVLELVHGWPQDGPLLNVEGGSHDEREAAISLLNRAGPVVVDLSALAELAKVDMLHLLPTLNRVLISSAARDAVGKLRQERTFIKSGSVVVAEEGNVEVRKFSPHQQAAELAHIEAVWDAIHRHCEVCPAYGPTASPASLAELGRALEPEEFAAVLLALEHEAPLLSLDGGLRSVAREFGVEGAWPQAMLQRCKGGALSQRDYSHSVLTMLCSNRAFVSLDTQDLLAMTDQGDAWFERCINSLRDYLARPQLEVNSAIEIVVTYFLALYRRGGCQVGVVIELFGHLLESILRHPGCPPGLYHDLSEELAARISPGADKRPGLLALLDGFAARALNRSKRPSQRVRVKARVLYVTDPPTIQNGLTADEDMSEAVPSENHSEPMFRQSGTSEKRNED